MTPRGNGQLIAGIPVRNALEWTQPLVESLLNGDEVDQVWLFDNGSTDDTARWAASLAASDVRLTVVTRPRERLHGMWNEMVSRASEISGAHLAILNNDIRLHPGTLRRMRAEMTGFDLSFIDPTADDGELIDVTPTAAEWTERTGWMFMLRADFWRNQPFAIDPGLRWWWGDDDLARRAQERGGKLCTLEGLGCFHAISQSEYPGDFRADAEHDRVYFRRIWNDV
jgi:GT2 family glycosyltransferase